MHDDFSSLAHRKEAREWGLSYCKLCRS